jgi:CHAT domain-containing protein/tetratricopeptide (TPR) repeat protein
MRGEIDDQPGLAYTHYGIAITHWTNGERQLALDAAKQCEQIWRKLKNSFGLANVLNSMGLLYAELGDERRAHAAYDEAMTLWKQVHSEPMQAYTHNNLGMLAVSEGRYAAAAREFAAALPILESTKDQRGIAYVLHNQGDLALLRGKPTEAIPLYNRSRELKRAIGDRYGDAITAERIAAALRASGKPKDALVAYSSALSLHREIGNRSGELMTIAGMARTHRDLGDSVSSRLYFQQALELAERDRGSITHEDLRTSYFTTVQDLFSEYIDFLCSRFEATRDQGFLEEAFVMNERSRARQLLDALVTSASSASENPARPPKPSPEWLLSERRLRSKLRASAQRLQRLHSVNGDPAEQRSARARFERLMDDWADHHATISHAEGIRSGLNASTAIPSVGSPGTTDLLDVLRAQVLDEDTSLIEFRIGPKWSFAWRLSRGEIAFTRLPPEATIAQSARRYLKAIRAREPSPEDTDFTTRQLRIRKVDATLDTAAQELSWLLLADISRDIKAKRLVLIPDGILTHVPFSALPQPYNPVQPMVEKWELTRVPSGQVLAALLTLRSRSRTSNLVTVLADPVFDVDDVRLQTKLPIAQSELAASSMPQFSPVTVPLPRLRFTREEARRIESASKQPVQVYSGFDANRDTLTNGVLENSRVLHFATHAWVDERSPAASGIAFSNFRMNGELRDGTLRLFEIYDLSVTADLVVLSGCRTAGGEYLRGEGVDGLVRAFLHAGAPRVVATLWDVQDASTAEFMGHFYRFYLGEQLPAAAALRKAQFLVRHTEHMSHPYYWAGFVLEGDWH